MSTPISSIALTANGLTCVASVPALIASKWSPARCLSSPSAIWLLAELWVHRNRILFLSPKLGSSLSGRRKTPVGASDRVERDGQRRRPAARWASLKGGATRSTAFPRRWTRRRGRAAAAWRRRDAPWAPSRYGPRAARAGDDELGVEADPTQGRRGEGG